MAGQDQAVRALAGPVNDTRRRKTQSIISDALAPVVVSPCTAA